MESIESTIGDSTIGESTIGESTIRDIILPPISPSNTNTGNIGGTNKKPRKEKKRIITTTKKWNFTEQELNNQYNIVLDLLHCGQSINKHNTNPTHKFVVQQIKQKLSSYKYQDQLKGIYDDTKFANSIDHILLLLHDCQLMCFYCQKTTAIIYENVCEPGQWTIERIDNAIGHNYDNICIACLKCNIGRRTMHQKRYLFTKSATVVELENHP